MASGTSSGWVAHQAMMLLSFISSSAIALISTSSASTTSGSLMNLQHRTNCVPAVVGQTIVLCGLSSPPTQRRWQTTRL
jgi:hypothetical protein